MADSREQIHIKLWQSYRALKMEIVPSLAGVNHEFTYRGFPVMIKFPSKPRRKDWRNFDIDSPISCNKWRLKTSIPLSYSVHRIDTYLDTGMSRKIPSKALGVVDSRLFSNSEQERLNKLLSSHVQILEDAFNYWIDVLRWKSGIPTLCHFEEQVNNKWSTTYLVNSQSNERFFSAPYLLNLEYNKAVTKRAWTKAQEALSKNLSVPIWHIYLAEAHQRLRLGDQRRFIIDLAIAIETVVRQAVEKFLRIPINSTFQKKVSRMSIESLLSDWRKMGFNNVEWKRVDINQVRKVVEERNAIMHRGKVPLLDKEECKLMGEATTTFVKQAEKEIPSAN